MIALVTDSACARCPLSLVCKTGQDIIPKRMLHIRYCPRCWAVIFEDLHETYICGLLRQGYHNGLVPRITHGRRQVQMKMDYVPPSHGHNAVHAAVPGIHTTFTACSKIYHRPHPYEERKKEGRLDKRDCIKYYRDRKQFTEER